MNEIDSKTAGRPRIIAHRGASRVAPENTLAAIEEAWALGVDAIETDIRLTADGTPVLFHDADFRRIAGDGRRLGDITCTEARSIDVGVWKGKCYQGERIPTLEEALETTPAGGAWLLEIKEGPECVDAMARIVESSGLPMASVILCSFREETMEALAARLPTHPRALLAAWLPATRGEPWSVAVGELCRRARLHAAVSLSLEHHRSLDGPFAAGCREAGLEWMVWTVNDPAAVRRYADVGAAGIISDDPRMAAEALETGGQAVDRDAL